jgi:hypothetical protein
MTPEHDRHRLALWTLVACLAALAIWPLWAVLHLPLPEWPAHLRQATILHDWDALPLYRQAFERSSGPTPLSAFPWLAHQLGRLHDVEWAGRVLWSVALLGTLAAAWGLLRTAGRSRWLLVAVLPWLWHAEAFQGNADFVIALPLALSALLAHLRLLQAPSWPRAGGLAVALAVLATAHWLWLPLWWVVIAASVWHGARQRWQLALTSGVRELALGLPGLLLLVPWWRASRPWPLDLQPTTALGTLADLPSRWFDHFLVQGASLEGAADLFLRRPGELAAFLWAVAMVLWVRAGLQHRRAQLAVPPSTEQPAVALTSTEGHLARLALLWWVVVVALPAQVATLLRPGAQLVPLAAILGALAVPLRPFHGEASALRGVARGPVWAGLLGLTVVAALQPLATLEAFVLSEAEIGPLTEAAAALPTGASVLTLRSRTATRWLKAPALAGAGHWYDVLRGGYVPNTFSHPWARPVRAKPEAQRPVPPDDPDRFRPDECGTFYDFWLVYEPVGDTVGFDGWLKLQPRIHQRGPWAVYQNLEVTPFVAAGHLSPPDRLAAGRLAACLSQVERTPPVLAADAPEHQLRVWLGCTAP